MGPLFTRARFLAYQPAPAPAPKPQRLSRGARLCCALLTLALAPFLLLAFLLLGERPSH